jgi:hypothetical protein
MFWQQFVFQNLHFCISFLLALALFGIFWLQADAWWGKKTGKGIPVLVGYLFLSLAYLLGAAHLESKVFQTNFIGNWLEWISMGAKLIGVLGLILGLAIDPWQPRPKYKTEGWLLPLNFSWWQALPGLGLLTVALQYWGRATLGLEHHLRRLAFGFLFLSISELVGLASWFRDTDNPGVIFWVRPFGGLWFLETLLMLIAMLTLAWWVSWYLLRRVETKVFMFMVTGSVLSFMIMAVVFSGLLVNRLQQGVMESLQSSGKTLQYTFKTMANETRADATLLAGQPDLIKGIKEANQSALAPIAEQNLLAKKMSKLLVIDVNGKILASGDDPEMVGLSLSENPLFLRTIKGNGVDTITVATGLTVPALALESWVPVMDAKEIVGVIGISRKIDEAFLEGVTKETGLSASFYAGNKLAVSPNQGEGTLITNAKVVDALYKQGASILTQGSWLNEPYLLAYEPLKDVDGVAVGALMVGLPQLKGYQAAAAAMEQTFIIAIGLLVLILWPIKMMANNIAKDVK